MGYKAWLMSSYWLGNMNCSTQPQQLPTHRLLGCGMQSDVKPILKVNETK